MKFKKIISLLLSISMLSGLSIVSYAEEEPIILLSGSDFQSKSGGLKQAKDNLTTLMTTAKNNNITKADGLLFAGDYDYLSKSQTLTGINSIKNIVKDVVTENMIFAQGEMDDPAYTAQSGNNDPQSGAYGVFVINADDFGNVDTNESKIKQTAQNLIDYLNDKLANEWTKPIFIVSHNSLHYSMQTKLEGDAIHSKYIFDALTAAGQKGLNIFFLYGKNHDHAFDDYLGGACVYLKKQEDTILIPDHSKDAYSTHTLAFYYMSAGYTGMYLDRNPFEFNGNLTVTSYKIYDSKVDLCRYGTKNRIMPLKEKGVKNNYIASGNYSNNPNKYTEPYQPNTKEYESVQTVELNKTIDKTPIPNLIEPVESEFVNKAYAHKGDGFGVALKVNTDDVSEVSFKVENTTYPASLYNGNWVAYVPGIATAGTYTITALIKNSDAVTTEKTQTFTVYDKSTVIGGEYRIKLYRGDGGKMWSLSSTSEYELYYSKTNADVTSCLYSIIDISSITNKDLIEKAYFVTSTGVGGNGNNNYTSFVIEECAEFTSTTFTPGQAPASLPQIGETAASGAYSATKVTASDIDYNILTSKVPVKSGTTANYIKLDATEYIKGKLDGNATKLHLRTSVRHVNGTSSQVANNNAELKLYIKYKDPETIDNYDGTTSYVVDARNYGKTTVFSVAAHLNGEQLEGIDSCNTAARTLYRYKNGEANPTIFVWDDVNNIVPMRLPIIPK